MIILYYHDQFENQHRVPLGNYSMLDAQALINIALERKQVVSFILGGREHALDMRTAQRVLVVEESYEQEILQRVAEADEAEGSEDYEDEEDTYYEDPEDPGPFA